MPTQVQFRRGTTAQNNNFTGAAGELSVNTSNNTIRVHDGVTAGGYELAKAGNIRSLFVGTSADVAAVVSDETGSGSLVFASSPTLVTPVLGLATGTSVMLSANVGAAAGNVSGNFTAGNFQTSGNLNAASGLVSGNFTVGNMYVNGNVFITGTTTTLNSNVTVLEDPIIYLADNSTSDILDIGFVATFNNGLQQHTGFIRDATDSTWKLFANVISEPNVNGTVDFTDATYSNLRMGSLTAIDVAASGNVTGTNLYAYSDETLKTDIAQINNAVEKVQALNGVYFTWKNNQQRSMGLIAQQVEPVEPTVVSNTPEGFKAVNYSSLVGLLIEAINEQQLQIEDLKKRIDNL